MGSDGDPDQDISLWHHLGTIYIHNRTPVGSLALHLSGIVEYSEQQSASTTTSPLHKFVHYPQSPNCANMAADKSISSGVKH